MSHFSPLAIGRLATALGILLSVLARDAEALRRSAARTFPGNATTFFKDPGQVLSVPLRRVEHTGVATPSLARRLFKTDLMGAYGAAYLAELAIGTSDRGRAQVVDVLIDTGSFELWVNPMCSTSNLPLMCQSFGHYEPTLSKTSRKLGGDGFSIAYGSGTVSGDYYTDDVYISGVKIQSQQFGVATSSELVWFGIMGLGHGQGNGFINHPLVIDSLAAQGFTNTKLFSLDLGGEVVPGGGATGEMVFGGVDTNKYAGLLKKVPTDPSDAHYKITLDSLAHRAPGDEEAISFMDGNLPLPVIVDSGTTLSLLPEPIVSKLAAQFPGATPDGNGGYHVDCAYQGLDGTVDFTFLAGTDTVTINVAYRDFIWNTGSACVLGAWYTKDIGVWILGDTFLRAAYVAFDQTNHALFMSNYVPCDSSRSRLVAVPVGPDAAGRIPGTCPELSLPPFPSWMSSSYPSNPTGMTTIASRPETTPVVSPGFVTEVPLINPTDIPAQTGSIRTITTTICSDDSSVSVGMNSEVTNPPPAPDVTSTITGTLIRTIELNPMTGCPDSEPNCTPHGPSMTRFGTLTATFRPDHSHDLTTLTAAPDGPSNTHAADKNHVADKSPLTKADVIATTATFSSPDTTQTRIITIAATVHVPLPTHGNASSAHTIPVVAGAGRLFDRWCLNGLLAIWGVVMLIL